MPTNRTPGPWTAEHYSGTDAYSNVWSPDGILVDGRETYLTYADAELIAAAPDLLDALRELCADPYLADPINDDRMAKAKASIAKAEGSIRTPKS